jgi:hypothetical protein
MPISHGLIGLAMLGGLAALICFAFGQSLKVKQDRNKDPDEWSRYGGPRSDGAPSDDGHSG